MVSSVARFEQKCNAGGTQNSEGVPGQAVADELR